MISGLSFRMNLLILSFNCFSLGLYILSFIK